MLLDREDIEKLSILSRISINEAEIEELSERLHQVLGLVNELQKTNTEGVPPMAHPLRAIQRMRDDKISETNSQEEFGELSQSTHQGLYLVPKVIE